MLSLLASRVFFSVFSVPSLLFMLSLPPPSSQILGPCQAVYSGVVCRTPLPCHDLFRWAGAPLARRIQSAPGILILGVRSPCVAACRGASCKESGCGIRQRKAGMQGGKHGESDQKGKREEVEEA